MTTKLRVVGQHILVEQKQAADKSEGGIVLPEQVKKKPREGQVVALGTGSVRTPNGEWLKFEVQVGDEIFFHAHTGTEVKIDDKPYLILLEKDVLMVVNTPSGIELPEGHGLQTTPQD